MGSSASSNTKKKSQQAPQQQQQQPLSTQNPTMVTLANASAVQPTTTRQLSTHLQSRSPQSRGARTASQSSHTGSSSDSDGRATAPRAIGGSASSSSDDSKKSDDDEEANKQPAAPAVHNLPKDSTTRTASARATTFRPTVSNSSLSNSNSVSKHPAVTNPSVTQTLVDPVGRCPRCPHCQGQVQDTFVKGRTPEPQHKWIIPTPRENYPQINMDDYDEDAIRKKRPSQRDRLLGSYDYSPNLKIDEKEDYTNRSTQYTTLPLITNPTSIISPSHTPFPDYEKLQRREQRFNKPYSLTLYND